MHEHIELMEDVARMAREGREGRLTPYEADFVEQQAERLIDLSDHFRFTEPQHELALEIQEKMKQ